MKRVGFNRYAKVTEGALLPPPPTRVGPFNNKPRKASGQVRKHFEGETHGHLPEEFPGWQAWRGRTRKLEIQTMPAGSVGRPAGLPDGMTKAQLEEHRKTVQEFLNKDEITKAILEQLKDENPIVQATMRFNLEVMHGDYGIRERLAAAKELNLYYKSKPAVKQEVTVNADDAAWDSDIESFAAEGDNWSTKPN